MGIHFLIAILVAAVLHTLVTRTSTGYKITELFLVYLLAGYCGFFVLGISLYGLADGEGLAAMFGLSSSGSVLQFLCFTFLGMSVIAILAIWLRGRYLIAPAVCWSIFWLGATYVHLAKDLWKPGHASFQFVFSVFLSHGFVALLLTGLLIATLRLKRISRDES